MSITKAQLVEETRMGAEFKATVRAYCQELLLPEDFDKAFNAFIELLIYYALEGMPTLPTIGEGLFLGSLIPMANRQSGHQLSVFRRFAPYRTLLEIMRADFAAGKELHPSNMDAQILKTNKNKRAPYKPQPGVIREKVNMRVGTGCIVVYKQRKG